MHFGNLREMLGNTGKDRKIKKVSDTIRKTSGAFRHHDDR